MSLSAHLRSTRLALLLLASLIAAAVAWTGGGVVVERALDPVRFAAADRPASGRIVVVEMDAASVAEIRSWPWPRRHYAVVVDRLRRAGAASITFDVDFSSTSAPSGDAALGDALRRAKGLVALPTFAQDAGSGERRQIDALPIPRLREHAALASVSMTPDGDGLVRRAPIGTVTAGTPRPSLSAHIARRSGQAGTYFPIDFGVDADTLPRLSFVAVRDGRFNPAQVRGREVVIGATAVEMGDRYGVPRWGVIPGVIVQALAAETLLRGVSAEGSALTTLAFAALLAALIILQRSTARIIAAALASVVALAAAAIWVQARFLLFYPIAPGLLLLGVAFAGRVAMDIVARFSSARLVDEATGLPNRRALLAADRPVRRIAMTTIVNYDQLVAVLEAGERDLVLRLVERLRLAAEGARTYRLSDRALAFAIEDEDGRLDALRTVMLNPIEVHGRHVDVSLAVGVADIGEAGLDAALAQAALAGERAAREGEFWLRADADIGALERQVSLMGELDKAIEAGEIEVHYQPKLAVAADRVVSAEALVRWRHRTHGFVGPGVFIPLAEQTGRIGPLTLHVLETAIADLARWRAEGHELSVAINISAKLVSSENFNKAVGEVLKRSPVPPASLIFEVTESAAITDPASAVAALNTYRDMGVAISMDDYGTGQSSLSYLQQLPLSEIKIDQSFVRSVHTNRNDAVLVRSTVELAHQLGLKVVAEGIEDEAALAFLRSINCDLAQGYWISRPLKAHDFLQFVAGRIARAA